VQALLPDGVTIFPGGGTLWFLQATVIFIPALPFCHRRISCKKPKDCAYPKELLSLGDHLRKHRLDQGLLQKEVAERLGVDEATVFNWEKNRNQPALAHIPRIIRFLGYNPLVEEGSLGKRLKQYRKVHGISQKDLARRLGVDPGTLAQWERGKEIFNRDRRLRVQEFLKKKRTDQNF